MPKKGYKQTKEHIENRVDKMKKSPIIHHIDGNHKNNNPNNLIEMKRKEHNKLHSLQRFLVETNPNTKKAIKKVVKVGNDSLMIILPKTICKRLEIKEGDYIIININKIRLT